MLDASAYCSYIKTIEFEWDSNKEQANKAKHGVEFKVVDQFEWDGALIREDDRYNYGETRFVAQGMIGSRLHVLVYSTRGNVVRVIGLRKANKREERAYHAK